MVPDDPKTKPSSQLKIEQRAYEIWMAAGQPCGCELDHWLLAEHELSFAPAPDSVALAPSEPLAPVAHAPTVE